MDKQRRPMQSNTRPASHLPPLSQRESEVLSWVAEGKIGIILGISRRTVDAHLAHAYQKLGVETRMAAVMRMLNLMKLAVIWFVPDFCSDLSFFSDYF
jgi:DNA-binding CsgD family transcriptional regulator